MPRLVFDKAAENSARAYGRTCGAIWNSTDHMIQGPSKEHEHTKVEFCGIVIPNENGKKFPKYYLQPTLEIKIQHSKIEELVE